MPMIINEIKPNKSKKRNNKTKLDSKRSLEINECLKKKKEVQRVDDGGAKGRLA